MKTKVFEDLIDIAREWRDFSRQANGWNCQTYDCKNLFAVRCYFSDDGSHAAVIFKRNHTELAHVAFHSTPQISYLTLTAIAGLEKIIAEAEKALQVLVVSLEKRTQAEVEQKKKELIEGLERRLAEAKGEPVVAEVMGDA